MHLFPTGLAPSDARTVRDKMPLHRARVASPVTITACVLPATVAAGGSTHRDEHSAPTGRHAAGASHLRCSAGMLLSPPAHRMPWDAS